MNPRAEINDCDIFVVSRFLFETSLRKFRCPLIFKKLYNHYSIDRIDFYRYSTITVTPKPSKYSQSPLSRTRARFLFLLENSNFFDEFIQRMSHTGEHGFLNCCRVQVKRPKIPQKVNGQKSLGRRGQNVLDQWEFQLWEFQQGAWCSNRRESRWFD
jgi:hypothetical protein